MTRLRSYLLSRLFRGYGVMIVILAALVWLMELLERLGDAGAGEVGLFAVAWSAMRLVPGNLLDLLPIVAILATATVMAAMQSQSELTVMRASGVSLLRITRIALVPGLGLALAALVALQWLTPVLHSEPDRLAASGLGETSLWHPWHGLWVRSDTVFLNIGQLELGRLPAEVNIFEFDSEGHLARQIQAARAIPDRAGNWRLEEVQLKRFGDNGVPRIEQLDQYDWPSFLTVRQLDLLRQAPASLPLTDLWGYVRGLKARDQDAAEFELVFWRRVALPLACMGMVLLAMALAAVPLKSRAASLRITAAVAVGLGYQMLTGLISFFGLVIHLPAAPVALAPPVLLAVLAAWLLSRAR